MKIRKNNIITTGTDKKYDFEKELSNYSFNQM